MEGNSAWRLAVQLFVATFAAKFVQVWRDQDSRQYRD